MKKVPIVVYENGKRKVIGEAVVHDSGAIEGTIDDDISLDGVLQAGMVFGASFGPFKEYKE